MLLLGATTQTRLRLTAPNQLMLELTCTIFVYKRFKIGFKHYCLFYVNDAKPLALLKKLNEGLKAGKRSKEISVVVLKSPDIVRNKHPI